MNERTLWILIGIIVCSAGYLCGYYAPHDCRQEYNRGYGDGFHAQVMERMQTQAYREASNEYRYASILDKYLSNTTVLINNTPWGIPNQTCHQNETGQDPSDLVMHFTCEGES